MKKNKAIKTKNPYIKLPSLVQKHLKKKKKREKKMDVPLPNYYLIDSSL
jgi:hypothetical protein